MRTGKIVISTILLLMFIIGMGLCLIPVQAEPLDTYHSPWNKMRDVATEDGADFASVYNLDGDEGGFASKSSGAFHVVPMNTSSRQGGFSKGAVWDIAINGGLADNDTFSWTLVGWARANGMLQVIANGTGIIGTQDVVIYPDGVTATNIWWADTLVITDSPVLWNNVKILNSGNNNIAFIHVDIAGLEWLQVIIYDADGTGTEANNLSAFGKRY